MCVLINAVDIHLEAKNLTNVFDFSPHNNRVASIHFDNLVHLFIIFYIALDTLQ